MIEEIDYNKYIVIKRTDLQLLDLQKSEIDNFNILLDKIYYMREKLNKSHNKYLVLNIDDEFDILYLKDKIKQILLNIPIINFSKENYNLKIRDISIYLINSILMGKNNKGV